MVIKIHIYLFLVMAYMFAIGNLENFLIAYIFIILHEIAHILISIVLQVKVQEIELLPIGVNAKYLGRIAGIKELLISIAGPFTSFLFYKFLKISYLKKINLFIAIANLIPLKPYDGGRIIHSIITLILDENKANRVFIEMQKKSLNFLTILAIIALVKFKNYYLSIACIYMICIVKEELKNEKFNTLIKYLQID